MVPDRFLNNDFRQDYFSFVVTSIETTWINVTRHKTFHVFLLYRPDVTVQTNFSTPFHTKNGI